MAVYLAVDAGGAKTECWIADEDRVLAKVTGEPLRPRHEHDEQAAARLRQFIAEASAAAGLPPYLITRSCAGFAGLDEKSLRNWAHETLRETLTGELLLAGEEEIALEAAFRGGAGVLVDAGDDSWVIGRCSNGSRFRAGGWGPVLGDEGSAHWIGMEGIRSGLRALDRGVPSCLLREVNAQWGTTTTGSLLARASAATPPEFSQLAEGVLRCAAQGDALARSVLERAGEELAAQISMVCSKMRAAGCHADDTERVAFTGTVLTELAGVREAMTDALRRMQPGILVEDRATEPVEGALAKARRG